MFVFAIENKGFENKLSNGGFGVHKDLSNSYREGIDEKLTCMAQPYKTKVLRKVNGIRC